MTGLWWMLSLARGQDFTPWRGFSLDHPEQISSGHELWEKVDYSGCALSEDVHRWPAFPSESPENIRDWLNNPTDPRWVNGKAAACILQGALQKFPQANVVRVPILPGTAVLNGKLWPTWATKSDVQYYKPSGFCPLAAAAPPEADEQL